MTKEEWETIPLERRIRFADTVRDFGLRCIGCGENLTKVEKLEQRAYCQDCWPGELDWLEE